MIIFKRFFIILVLCFILMSSVIIPVYADVISEPHDNDFYRSHTKDCVHVDRDFYVDSPDGSVSLKKEPGSESEVIKIENGEIIRIMFTYDYNGEIWGVTEIRKDANYRDWPAGWIPMDQLVLVYDYISFAEDHNGEFYPYTGNYDKLQNSEQIVFWKYPESGIINITATDKKNINEYFENLKDRDSRDYFAHAYKDEQGREWGFTGWGWYGYKNSWVCLSEPENADIPANPNAVKQPQTVWPADTDDYSIDSPNTGLSEMSVIIILIIVLILATGIFIRIFWKPNKK